MLSKLDEINKVLEDAKKEPAYERYQEAKGKYDKIYEALEKTLNEEQKELLFELSLAKDDVQDVLGELFFENGLLAGWRLIKELQEEK